MAKVVGVVFDNPEFQMSQMSVAEEIALGLENAGVPYEDMKQIIPETLELVGLAGYEERSPLSLSGTAATSRYRRGPRHEAKNLDHGRADIQS